MSYVTFSILGVLYFYTCSFFPYESFPILIIIISLSQFIVIKDSGFKYESPQLWYSSAVFIYHFSTLFLYVVGYYDYEKPRESILLYGIIYYSAVLPLFLCTKKNINNDLFSRFDLYFDRKALLIINYFFMALVILANFYFFNKGFENKGDAILSGGTKFNFIYNWASVANIVFLIRIRKGNLFYKHMVIGFLIFLFTALNTGERNVILSYTLCLIIILVVMNKLSQKKSLIYLFFAAISIPILQELKTIFSKDIKDIVIVSDSIPFYVKFLQGEFRSASRNLDWLLARDNSYEITYGTNILKDILIGFSPLRLEIYNSQTWYNQTFFPHIVDTGQGYGFSLYGSFYIALYAPGLIILSLLFSLAIVLIYNLSKYNLVFFLISILMITPLIYSQRGDLSVVLAFMVKQTLLPLFIFYILNRFMRRIC
ncbi:TPA: hypothetical protein ACMDPA_002595 [Vibrio cholerae]